MDLFQLGSEDLRSLRANAPVHRDETTGLWLVSRYDDVRAVLADPRRFHPDNALTAVTAIPRPVLRVLARAGFSLPPTLANNGTDTHTDLRRLVARFLTPARVEAMRPRIAELARERLARVAGPVADLHPALARDLPAIVLMEVMGIERVDIPLLKAWSTASLELFWGNPALERQYELAAPTAEFHRWLTSRLRAARGDDDLFGALRDVPVREAAGLCYFLLIAGQETTTQLLSAVLDAVLRQGDLWSRLDEPGLAGRVVEEVLRRDPPVTTWRRIAAEPVTIAGVAVPAGAHLLLMLAGSGSDPAVFAEPERLCPVRPNARKHLAFGFGRHFCLGAGLARLEAEVVLREAFARFPNLRLASAQPPPMLGLLSFRAPLSVLVDPGEPAGTPAVQLV
ncbi:cytochrome P450 [Actinosynnema sp. NPDC047251]|uniref:Cytochrome P450 family protein n=1 Tax=Saccharothrix espanaensis (strain ATCC 51144 / DSM 44229 / JCM 9112 / NBRC 15066 / NRRL 15764) TaxID=1179773 RepID=K0K7D0_SACES|nr:cytochrome P450 [Saccharothrix espanaensis]CCH34261.1 Cytochrome P450 family protein [Saccharothrix espanaensis DSM 44229]